MKKILMGYTTKTGTTAEVSAFVGKELKASGAEVEVRDLSLVRDLSDYRAVIIGSPLMHGECMPIVFQFLERNQTALSKKPVAYFFTCMIVTRIDDASKSPVPLMIDPALKQTKSKEPSHGVLHYVNPLMEEIPDVRPVQIAFFKGKLDFKKLDLFSLMTMKLITAFTKEVREGDYRNWDLIRSWTKEMYPQLTR